MTTRAVQRRAILRALYEEWNVPADLLHKLTDMTSVSFHRLIEKEVWESGPSSASIQAKMLKSFDEQVMQLSETAASEPLDEKLTRAFAAMAKILETFAAVDTKIATTQKLGEHLKQDHRIEPDNPLSTAERTSELEKRFAELVKGLASNK